MDQTCDRCGETLTRSKLALEDADPEHPIHFHVAGYHMWDAARRALGLQKGPRLPAPSARRGPGGRPARSWAPLAPRARQAAPEQRGATSP